MSAAADSTPPTADPTATDAHAPVTDALPHPVLVGTHVALRLARSRA